SAALSTFFFFSFFHCSATPRPFPSSPTRRSSDLAVCGRAPPWVAPAPPFLPATNPPDVSHDWLSVTKRRGFLPSAAATPPISARSEEHTSELQSRGHLVCRLLLEKKKKQKQTIKQ